ncbi:MAG: hypothetical protein SPG98_06460 [Porcincola intestinalis]|uniref:hypothetical protein n=1 Tax=Porcincola intestinalis TaxID=2606632 RepID=UPI002A91F2C4|nr:hypothetical protein [Porcincola intestinalis]MDY5332393.1 hypothetical protein [Porcincola intestinalis]
MAEETVKKIASYLAVNFSSLLKRQKRLKTLKEFGPIRYTEDMAVADLTSISVNTGSDKVQTSGISKVPERVAIMLESGYVEKMQEKMNQEYEDLCEELEYVSWQLDIIDAAMEERMTERQRVIFRWVYLEKMSLRYIHNNLMPECSLGTIKNERDNAVQQLAEEVRIRKATANVVDYFQQLGTEAERDDGVFESDQRTRYGRRNQKNKRNTKAPAGEAEKTTNRSTS